MIPFNKPFISGKESFYMEQAMHMRKLSGNGVFTEQCQAFMENKYGFKKCFLTTSCTDALEMTALLLELKEGDEIIVPSFTFVTSALAFVRQGATVVFADSLPNHPNGDPKAIEAKISSKTKAIIIVHYGGVAVDMDAIMKLAEKHSLYVIEDAAHAIDAFYKKKPLGSFGHFGVFSFHETKNITSGEGGMLCVNDKTFIKKAEVIWEKGTNRASFFRGEVNKYSWVGMGSSFLPSELTAAFLFAQLEKIDKIQQRRQLLWNNYHTLLSPLEKEGHFKLPDISENVQHNAHLYYIVCNSEEERKQLINYLGVKKIQAVFHYLSLHKSPYYLKILHAKEECLINAEHFSACLLRLPLFYELSFNEQEEVVSAIHAFYRHRK